MKTTKKFKDVGLDTWNDIATSQGMLEPQEAERGRDHVLR